MAKNFAYSTVLTAPSPASSGTSLVVQSGDGAKFPTEPFLATAWPIGVQPTTTNAEIILVSSISTDTFTIVRAQESSSARTVIVGDQIAATLTKGVWRTYTPTIANLTLGNGTNVGAYTTIGQTVLFRWTFTLGSTSAVGTAPTFTLPIAPAGMTAAVGWITGKMNDNSATQPYPLTANFVSGSTMLLHSINASFNQALDDTITATVPFTWAVSDVIQVGGSYEMA